MEHNKKLTVLALFSLVLPMQCSGKAHYFFFSGNSSNVNINGSSININGGNIVSVNGNVVSSISSNSSSSLLESNGYLVQLEPGDQVMVSGNTIEINGKQIDPATTVTRFGKNITEKVSLGSFNEVNISRNLALIKQSLGGDSCLVCDSNFADFVKIHNEDGTLIGKLSETRRPFKTDGVPPCILYASLPNQLEVSGNSHVEIDAMKETSTDQIDLSARGSSTVRVGNVESSGTTDLSVSGAAELHIDNMRTQLLKAGLSGSSMLNIGALSAESLQINSSGCSSTTIEAGSVDKQEVTTSGSSTYNSRNLTSAISKIMMSGSSSAIVHTMQKLYGRLSGATKLKYRGNPQVNNVKTCGCSSTHPIS